MDPNFKHLTEEEIDQFLSELDTDNDGLIEYHEVEAKLDEVSREIGKQCSLKLRTTLLTTTQLPNPPNIISTMKTAPTNAINFSEASWAQTKTTSPLPSSKE